MSRRIRSAAVDLGGSSIKIGLLEDSRLITSETLPLDSSKNLGDYLPRIKSVLEQMFKARYPVDGIGFSYPGIVDHVQGRALSSSSKYPDVVDLDLEAWVRQWAGLPFLMENDANAALTGEWKKGCARGWSDIVLFILGTGVGTAAVMEDRLVRGAHHQAGILGGHFKTGSPQALCSCRKKCCLEAECGSWTLDRRSKGAFRDYRQLLEASKTHDPLALSLLEDSISHWSRGISTLVHAYDPKLILLSGGVLRGQEAFLEKLKEQVRSLSWTPWGSLEFLVPPNPEHSVLLGLHTLIEEKLHGKN